MRDLKDAKKIYDNIVIPDELESRLLETLNNAQKPSKKGQLVRFSRRTAATAAALLVCFTAGLNTSQSFAMEASQLPVIGSIAKVLTMRSYETTEDTTTTKVNVPEIQVEADNKDIVNAVSDANAEIKSIVDTFTAQKYKEIAEYKKMFFETGGTEEEWLEHMIDVNVNYEVKYQDDTKLSILLDTSISYVASQQERHFYNIDLTTGKELTLTDLLGEDAYAYASEIVLAQMKEQISSDSDAIFWGVNEEDTMNEFIGVDEETPFYINKSGNIVISYDKYEAGPGAMGIQEFEIPAR